MFDIENPVHWLVAVLALTAVGLLLLVFFNPEARERRRRERNHRRVVSKAKRPTVSLAVKTGTEKKER